MSKKKKVRIKSKCKIWEKERRERMCKAFTTLVNILPATPVTAPKIIILQQAVKYIRELKLDKEKLLENEKAFSDQHKVILKKLSLFEDQCLQLVQMLKDAGLTVPSSIVEPMKSINHSSLSPSSVVHDITNKIHQEDETQSHTKVEESNVFLNCNNANSANNVDDGDTLLKILPLTNASDVTNSVDKDEIGNIAKIQEKNSKKPLKIRKKYPKKKLSTAKSNVNAVNTNNANVQCSANVLQKNSTINNVWLTNSNLNSSVVIGNTLFPFMPIASPIVMPTVPQPQTIFVVQRPPLSNSQVMKDSILPNKQMISLDTQNRSQFKSYPNIYNLDVTRTTMVNKVPISAFSNTSEHLNSKSTKKKRIIRVTQRAHRLKFSSKNRKDTKSLSSSTEEIENTDKAHASELSQNTNESISSQENKTTAPQVNENTVTDDKKIEISLQSKDSFVTGQNNENITSFTDNSTSDNIRSDNAVLSSCIKQSSRNDKNNAVEGVTLNQDISSTNKMENSNEINSNSNLVPLNNITEKPGCDNLEKMDTTSNAFDKSCGIPMSIDKSECDKKDNSCKENSDVEKVVDGKSNKYETVVENSSELNRHESTCEIDSENLQRLQKSKSSSSNNNNNNAIGANEIADDILASFGSAQEQTLPTSPLAASPLATSPTAAFLSAFPLVCSGLRPDTPLNDNLQTPNICSLDNFSSFFSSKDVTHTAVGLFADCHSKSSVQSATNRYKQHWLPNMSNNSQHFSKTVLPDINSTTKYNKNTECLRIPTEKTNQEKITVSSTACVYPESNPVYQNSKPVDSNSQYPVSNPMYSYDHLNLINNSKEQTKNIEFLNNKPDFNYESSTAQSSNKNKTSASIENVCTSAVSSYIENIPPQIGCNNGKSYNAMSATSSGDINNCKRDQSNDNYMKLVLPGVIPDYTPSSKSLEMSFAFPTQTKSVFHNTSNIYTSCNTYNPFSSDFSSNSMNLAIPCSNTLNPIRTKPSTSFIPDFNSSNVYPQNCNVWNEDNGQMEVETNKIDYNKKLNFSMTSSQSQAMVDFQSDIRFPPLPTSSKCYTKQNATSDSKSMKSNNSKCSTKEVKYHNEGKNKSECINQKGPVNWMTSDVGLTIGDVIYPNYKDIKNEQSALVASAGQPCSEPVSALNCKKTDMFDQPFFPLAPSGYVSQVVTEDNQFTWSPSKLTNFGDTASLAPCSLPTLVGDLALGTVVESKISYSSLTTEQESNVKDRNKYVSQKPKDMFANKQNCSQNVEINSTNSNNSFLSVSQLMDRGKMDNAIIENASSSKNCMQDSQKRSSENSNRQFNPQIATENKSYDLVTHSVQTAPLYPTDNYSVQQHIDNSLNSSKETHYSGKIDSSSKNTNKNNYSTEALLQNNDTNYQQVRKQKSSHNLQKNYGENPNFSISSNQYISSNHPLQFDNFSQNQQYVSNTFPYSGTGVTMNSTFYSSANLIPASNNTAPPNYINSGFPVEFGEFSNNLSDNIFYPPKTDTCKSKTDTEVNQETSKYLYNVKTISSNTKDLNTKTKSDACTKKDSSSQNKRQKKHRNSYTNNFSIPERCFGSIANQVNSPMGFDESYFGYGSASQMHSYPSQPSLLTGIQPTAQYNQKINFTMKPGSTINMSSSPNPAGISLTNFNLSTILSTDINKRSSVTGFSDSHHSLSNITKTLPSGLYN